MAFVKKTLHFHPILAFLTSKGCFFFPKSYSNAIHHWHPNINSMLLNAFMWPQWCYFNGCHIWHQWHEVSFDHFDAHHIGVPLTWIITSWQTVEDLLKWLKPLKTKIHAQLETFHHWWCPTRTKGIIPKHGKYDYTHD